MKIQIFTVVVGISNGKSWILKNFLKGIEVIAKRIDIHLNIVISNVPLNTEWGVVDDCDVSEIKNIFEEKDINYTIWHESDFEQNPNFNLVQLKDYPSTGESHSKVLDKIFWYFYKNLNEDFLLVMDYDSFFIPNKIDELVKILDFAKNEKVVFGGVEEEFKVKEIYENLNPIDYLLHANQCGKIEKGKRSIIYLPRIHPMFLLITKNALNELIKNDYLKMFPIKTINVFDDMDYIIYGDCGVFLLNLINKKTNIIWILKSTLEMPVYHYKGMTLKVSKNEIKTKEELKKIYLELYD